MRGTIALLLLCMAMVASCARCDGSGSSGACRSAADSTGHFSVICEDGRCGYRPLPMPPPLPAACPSGHCDDGGASPQSAPQPPAACVPCSRTLPAVNCPPSACELRQDGALCCVPPAAN